MIDNNYVEGLTKAYIHAHNTAMNEVRNPQFAAQIATSVLTVIALEMRNKQQSGMNPFTMILGAVMDAAKKSEDKKSDDGESERGEKK